MSQPTSEAWVSRPYTEAQVPRIEHTRMPTAGSRWNLLMRCAVILGDKAPDVALRARVRWVGLASTLNAKYELERDQHRRVTPLVSREQIAAVQVDTGRVY